MLNKKLVIFALILLIEKAHTQGQTRNALSQRVSQTDRSIAVHKTFLNITVDGNLTDEAWQFSAMADSFINKWPTDTGKARLQTTVTVTYDARFIYFGIRAEMTDKDPVIQSVKRDVNPYYSDGVSVVIDPSGK